MVEGEVTTVGICVSFSLTFLLLTGISSGWRGFRLGKLLGILLLPFDHLPVLFQLEFK